MNVVLKKRGWLALKLLVFGLTSYYMYRSVTGQDLWLPFLKQQHSLRTWAWFAAAALLIPLNWGLEASKWHLLAQKLEPIGFGRAFRAVMVGLTLGFITPNRVGDYAGRILELKTRNRADAIGAIFLGRFSQLVITVVAGSFGCYYLLWRFYLSEFPFIKLSIGFVALVANLVVMLLYFQPRIFISWLMVFKKLRPYMHYVGIIGHYQASEQIKLLTLASLRYLVFCLQFAFLLQAFQVQLPFIAFLTGITGTFLLKSVVPSLSALTDIGMREISAMHFFQLFGQEPAQVLSASLSLWFLNIALPSAAGLIFVARLKFKNQPK